MHPMQDLFLESFSYELQLDMHSYLHKNFILAKSGCYTACLITQLGDTPVDHLAEHAPILVIGWAVRCH
jgi:hypothetical protein